MTNTTRRWKCLIVPNDEWLACWRTRFLNKFQWLAYPVWGLSLILLLWSVLFWLTSCINCQVTRDRYYRYLDWIDCYREFDHNG
jgi:hypothetical protein